MDLILYGKNRYERSTKELFANLGVRLRRAFNAKTTRWRAAYGALDTNSRLSELDRFRFG